MFYCLSTGVNSPPTLSLTFHSVIFRDLITPQLKLKICFPGIAEPSFNCAQWHKCPCVWLRVMFHVFDTHLKSKRGLIHFIFQEWELDWVWVLIDSISFFWAGIVSTSRCFDFVACVEIYTKSWVPEVLFMGSSPPRSHPNRTHPSLPRIPALGGGSQAGEGLWDPTNQ